MNKSESITGGPGVLSKLVEPLRWGSQYAKCHCDCMWCNFGLDFGLVASAPITPIPTWVCLLLPQRTVKKMWQKKFFQDHMSFLWRSTPVDIDFQSSALSTQHLNVFLDFTLATWFGDQVNLSEKSWSSTVISRTVFAWYFTSQLFKQVNPSPPGWSIKYLDPSFRQDSSARLFNFSLASCPITTKLSSVTLASPCCSQARMYKRPLFKYHRCFPSSYFLSAFKFQFLPSHSEALPSLCSAITFTIWTANLRSLSLPSSVVSVSDWLW